MQKRLEILFSVILIIGTMFVLILTGIGSDEVMAKEKNGTESIDGSQNDAELIKEKVLENCGLSEEWTCNIAVSGYVYGDYIYFTKNSLWLDQNIYRINVNNYKIETYVKNAWKDTVYADNYVIFDTFYTANPKKGIYAKNLDTGKLTKIYNKNNTYLQYVQKYKDKFYYIKDIHNKRELYSVNTDGTGRKRIATRIIEGQYAFYNDGTTEKILYIRRYDQATSKYYKVYSANLDGSGKKLLKKIVYNGGRTNLSLDELNGEVVLTIKKNITGEYRPEKILYLFDGNKLRKVGDADDNPAYAVDRLEDGYRYRIRITQNLYEKENGRGLIVERQGMTGEWEVFSVLPYVQNLLSSRIEMHNGYLTIMMYDEDPYCVVLLDKNGDWLFTSYIAGYTDETNMHCTVVGNKTYIIHGAVYHDENGHEMDKYEVIDIDGLKQLYAKYEDVTLGEIQTKIINEMKAEGFDYKPGSENYNTCLKNTVNEILQKSSDIEKDRFLMNMYVRTYKSLFSEFLDVMYAEGYRDISNLDEVLDIDQIIDGNECIVYDEETEMYYFETSDSFLNKTMKNLIKNQV